MSEDKSMTESRRRGFDVRDANVRNVLIFAGGLLVFLGVSMVVLGWLYGNRLRDGRKPVLTPEQAMFEHSDGRMTSIQEMWKSQDRETELHLEGYRWVDKDAGIVQVPIERAMELVEEKEEK